MTKPASHVANVTDSRWPIEVGAIEPVRASNATDLSNEADRFLIHARALNALLAYADSKGLSQNLVDQELEALALRDVRVDAFDGFVSMSRFAKLMQRFGRLLSDEAIGLGVADHIVPDSIGVFGQAITTAPNLATTLDVMVRYMRLYADVSYAGMSVSDKRAEFSWAYSPVIVARDSMCDRAARLFVLGLLVHFGEDCRPIEVHLQRKRPADPAPFRKALCAKVVFDAPINMIVLRRADLDRVNVHADAYRFEVSIALADRMMSERRIPDDFSIRVREDILEHLAVQGPNMNETARRLGVSPRSLQRRLEDFGTTYQRLCDDIRITLAEELLTQTSMPISEIAYRLGFANQANLTRASRRWFGVSPRMLRSSNS